MASCYSFMLALFLDLIGRDWEVVGDKIVEMLYAVLKTENIQATNI